MAQVICSPRSSIAADSFGGRLARRRFWRGPPAGSPSSFSRVGRAGLVAMRPSCAGDARRSQTIEAARSDLEVRVHPYGSGHHQSAQAVTHSSDLGDYGLDCAVTHILFALAPRGGAGRSNAGKFQLKRRRRKLVPPGNHPAGYWPSAAASVRRLSGWRVREARRPDGRPSAQRGETRGPLSRLSSEVRRQAGSFEAARGDSLTPTRPLERP